VDEEIVVSFCEASGSWSTPVEFLTIAGGEIVNSFSQAPATIADREIVVSFSQAPESWSTCC